MMQSAAPSSSALGHTILDAAAFTTLALAKIQSKLAAIQIRKQIFMIRFILFLSFCLDQHNIHIRTKCVINSSKTRNEF